MSSPVTARPASTVIVLRDGELPFEVLLLKRHDKVAFMAGAYVFPGGRVDDADCIGVEVPRSGVRHFDDLDAAEEQTYRRAAVREVEEECGVRLDAGALTAFAHWVTPEIEIRRYDTRFFLARMPAGQIAQHDDRETTAMAWLTPNEALRQCHEGEILLPPPTWTTFRQLQAFASIDALFDWTQNRAIPRVEPGFVKTDRMTMLTLPGDPTFPTIPGWEIPVETRFVLAEGNRWVATPPPVD